MVMRHIMVATDGSSGGDRAVDFAAELAKAFGGTLSIMTVSDVLPGQELGSLDQTAGRTGDTLPSLSQQILVDARERAERQGVSNIHTRTWTGDPAAAIIEAAKHEKADAIVVGRRGHGRLAGLLLGSVSRKLVSLAPCTVIVVP
jgi:nucleotide-binding universal stress UspA family protein